jgi:hypothetical protein
LEAICIAKVLEASDEFGRSSLYFFQELDVFGAVRVPGGSGILEVGANKGGVQCTEGMHIPGLNALFKVICKLYLIDNT